MSATTTSSGASTLGTKVSIFAAKSGFVIPKNKLSGSLVPIFRGGKKSGGNEIANEDNTNQVLRKTKWGPDPTQDAAVKRGRALAYQTRVDQITQQLRSGILDPGETEDSEVLDQHVESKSSSSSFDTKDLELLKLERQEAIGEILKLNPCYKPPPDYVPLLKEATVPIPVKDHPGYNFVGLIFGPGGETQKRLEKETGAKIQLYGSKANTGEKVELSLSDEYETHVASYDELNVHISADTCEKVDGAVSLIEMLVTSVSGNLVSGNNANALSHEASSPSVVLTGDQGVPQSVVGPTQISQQGQFQYQGPQFPAAISAQALGHPPPAFTPLQNSSAPIHINLLPVYSSPMNPTTMPSLFGPRPIPASGFNSILQNASLVSSRPQLPLQVSSHPYPPRNFPMPAPQPSAAQSNVFTSLPFSGNQPLPPLQSPIARQLVPSLSVPLGPQSDRPSTPIGSSSGWSTAPAGAPASLGQGNMGQMVSLQVPRPVVPHPSFLPSNMPSAPTINVHMNHPTGASNFASVLPPQVGSTAPFQSSPAVMAGTLVPHASINPVSGNTAISSPVTSMLQPTPSPVRPSTITAPRPLHSGPIDFTFQPHPENPTAQSVPRPINRPMTQDPPLARSLMQPPSPQAPSLRLTMPNSIPSPGMHLFPRSQLGNQMGQTPVHMSANPFAGNSASTSVSPRVPTFSNASPIMLPPRNFNPTQQLPDLAGPFPPRPGNPLQIRQNFPAPITPRANFMAPSQQSSKNLHFASGPAGQQQIYDPFSPTSVPIMHQQQGGNVIKGRKQEPDPEYEDLMASVGVK
ncbi:hypothetical protein JCGZ_19216 [Jatropha curcas]|uniref:K Homology domain-containing protein n=1 Tax=Jatropha curcas TaxID=180498 RepID=A0A067LJA1_JATCU|nr:branchpoint-bridging protein [Jatropha curcas]KDP44349.1 hypothetical protein JCGZ_19216 [Jatropha curcas]